MKIYNLTQRFFYAIFIVITLSACTKTTPTSNSDVVESYYSLLQNNVDGSFLFQSQINNNPSLKNIVLVTGFFYNKKNDKTEAGGPVLIGGYQLLPDTLQYQSIHLSTDSLFGVDLTFRLIPPPSMDTASITATFYSPAAIYITNNSVVPAQINLSSDSSLPITWNADSRNKNGVNIYADFLPTRFPNDSLFNVGYKNEINNSVMVPDNGRTILPASFFSKFPIGANIMLFVGRGNAIIVQSGIYRYYLGGFINAMEPIVITK
jgi:hypothetical protein